jgi:hypothetical protein
LTQGDAGFSHGDIFDTLKQITKSKLVVSLRCPLESVFLTRALKSDLPPELREDIDATVEKSFDALDIITAGIDASRLKEGLAREQAINLIHWVVAGLVDHVLATIELTASAKQLAKITRDCNDYFDLLRTLFYK